LAAVCLALIWARTGWFFGRVEAEPVGYCFGGLVFFGAGAAWAAGRPAGMTLLANALTEAGSCGFRKVGERSAIPPE
jgi:TRAP-type C4-dicarboxylate transport system permease small subunit